METLNFPAYTYRVRTHGQSKQIFDSIRKRFVALTSEEWVRQHIISYLVNEKKFPASLMAVEMSLKLNTLAKRADVVIFNNYGKPVVLVECKAPEVNVSQSSFDQAARYCIPTGIKLVILTNGINHYCAEIDRANQKYKFLSEIPSYSEFKF